MIASPQFFAPPAEPQFAQTAAIVPRTALGAIAPLPPQQRQKKRSTGKQKGKQNKVVMHPAAIANAASPLSTEAAKSLPKRSPFPQWLRLLFVLQHGSSLITFCLATAVLIAYGSTVYIQQEWSTEYRKLERLQREKRELIAADELVKNQLAQQASLPGTGMVAPSPNNTIFLPKAGTLVAAPAPKTTTPLVEMAGRAPVGY